MNQLYPRLCLICKVPEKTVEDPKNDENMVNFTISDPFLDMKTCIDRLFHEWKTYGQLIIAFDYDNTVYDYYKKGYKYDKIIHLLRELKEIGCHLTVFTSCDESRFAEIREYLDKNRIPFDSINDTPDFIPFKGRKVYYNALLDDRAGLNSVYYQLKEVLFMIKMHKRGEFDTKRQDIDF